MRWNQVGMGLLTGCLTMLLALPTMAQPERNQQRGRGIGQDGPANRGPLNRGPSNSNGRFELRGPEVGAPLPDIQLFDENGQPVSLASIKGSYSVLVFGCLT